MSQRHGLAAADRAAGDPADALASLGDFRHVYQGATVDTDAPLLLRATPARAGA